DVGVHGGEVDQIPLALLEIGDQVGGGLGGIRGAEEDEDVGAAAASEGVGPLAARQGVGPAGAGEAVVPRIADELIGRAVAGAVDVADSGQHQILDVRAQ